MDWIKIDYNNPSTLPDADETVMIHSLELSEPVWMGYYTGDSDGIGPRWLTVEGAEVEVTHWMPMVIPPLEYILAGAGQ